MIIDKLQTLEAKEMNRYYVSKLILPMGRLLNLSECLDATFLDLQIGHNSKLILVG